jgi:DNA-binding response OmpR family regulator/chromosome segregation ATPase
MSFHVLLVEPDAGLADEIRRAFAPLGISITAVQAGEPALEHCKTTPPDLILLAAELPDMSGFSVCNRLKRAAASVPLVLYTGEATDAAIEAHRATRTRADEYLKKPFELADLLARAAGLLHADQPGPPPPPVPPAAPRPDGRRPTGEQPPVLQRVDSGQVAAKGLAAALEAARAGPPPPPTRPSRPAMPAAQPPAAASPPAGSTPPTGTPAAAPPPVPPPVPQRPVALGRVKTLSSGRDPFAVMDEWPRDPAPPKGTPEEKLEYFRERLRARDAFLAKVRDAMAEAKAFQAELSGERDLLHHDLEQERERALGLEGRLQEASQDAAAQAARIEDLRRQLEESETTRQSLSDVLNETMQQSEAAEQQWSSRVAETEAERARVEAKLAEEGEAHAKAVAALEAERADERARAEAARVEAEEAHAKALAAERESREQERTEATGRQQLAEERITSLGVERDRLQADLARQAEEHDAAIAGLEEEAGVRSRAAEEERSALRAQVEEATGRADSVEAELREAHAKIATLEENAREDAATVAEEKAALEGRLRQAKAETKAYEEKALAVEHAFQAKAAELVAAEQRIADLGAALDEGRATAEGTRGELARVEAARAEIDRRLAQLAAEKDQLGREVLAARRETENVGVQLRAEHDRNDQLGAEVERLKKLEPVAEEAARLRKDTALLKEMVQQRTAAAESAARAAQAAAAERARLEERLGVEGGRLQAHVARLEQELAQARRRIQDLEREAVTRENALKAALQETEDRRKLVAAAAADVEARHTAEVGRLKSAMVELERHLEARARAELQMKKRLQDLERAAQARPAAAGAVDPALVQQLKAKLDKLAGELEEMRGENDFLNGEVARYVQKNKDLAAQLAGMRET